MVIRNNRVVELIHERNVVVVQVGFMGLVEDPWGLIDS